MDDKRFWIIKSKQQFIVDEVEIDSEILPQYFPIVEDNMNSMFVQKTEICRICFSPASSATESEENALQKQRCQNINDSNVKVEFGTPLINGFCIACDNNLKKISSFVSTSLYNDKKLKNALRRENTVEANFCLFPNDIELSTYHDMKFGSDIVGNETRPEENTFSYKNQVKYANRKKKRHDNDNGDCSAPSKIKLSTGQVLIVKSTIRGKGLVPQKTFRKNKNVHQSAVKLTDCEKKSVLTTSANRNRQSGLNPLSFLEEMPFERNSIKEALEEDSHPILQNSSSKANMITLSEILFKWLRETFPNEN